MAQSMGNVNVRLRDLLSTVTLTVTMPAAYGVRVALACGLIRAAAFVLGMKVSIFKIRRGDA
jgi:hypothetical protein